MFEVFHEGVLQTRVDTHNDAFAYVLDHQSASFHHALKYETWRVEDRGNPHLDDRDQAILAERLWKRIMQSCLRPLVGDWIRFNDGKWQRVSHHWDFPADDTPAVDEYQTTDGGSFYLSEGGLGSYSGGLYPSIPATAFTIAKGESRSAMFWFFHHNQRTAHNGVDVWLEVPVWDVDTPINNWRSRSEGAYAEPPASPARRQPPTRTAGW